MHPNILLIVLDSVRAANTSLHGHYNETTPFLSEFSQSAIKYEQARAPSTNSRLSHVSMFTGTHVPEHQISNGYKLRPNTTIWETLRDKYGYSTGYFTENPNVRAGYGFTRGFETKVSRSLELPYPEADDPRDFAEESHIEHLKQISQSESPMKTFLNGVSLLADRSPYMPTVGLLSPDRDIYTKQLLKWIDSQSGPWAGFINLMDAHGPYRPGEFNHWATEKTRQEKLRWVTENRDTKVILEEEGKWDYLSSFESLYDGGIRRTDAKVEQIISWLANNNILDETFVVITADHGEMFGERSELYPMHRLLNHSCGAHESLLHVPLVVSPAEETKHGDVVKKPASLTKFPSAVLDTIERVESPSFVPEGPVLAATHSENPTFTMVGDTDGIIRGNVRVVYEETSTGDVKKYSSWGDASGTFEIKGASEKMKVRDDDGGITDEVFSGMSLRDEIRMSADEIDRGVQRHLKDLGYV